MVVMYLHGFRSTPESNKGKIMRKAFSAKMTFLAPDLNVGPTDVKEILLESVKSISPNELCLVGSSLGGFYATWLAEKIGCKAVLLNPATEPWCVINNYLGIQSIANTDRTIEVKPEFAEQVKEMDCREMYFCLTIRTKLKILNNACRKSRLFYRRLHLKEILSNGIHLLFSLAADVFDGGSFGKHPCFYFNS